MGRRSARDVGLSAHDLRPGRGYDPRVELRSERILLWVGLVAWAALGLDTLAMTRAGALVAPRVLGLPVGPSLGLEVFVLVLFGAAFAWFMGPGQRSAQGEPDPSPWWVPPLVASALLVVPLGYLAALLFPFMYAPRRALRALLALHAAAVGCGSALAVKFVHEHGREVVPVLLIATDLAVDVGWRTLAFGIGLVAVSEQRRRRELAGLHGALLAAQAQLRDRARLEERLDIARDLHDSAGHHLVALGVQLELASRVDAVRAREAVLSAKSVAAQLLKEVREVVSTLRAEPAPELDEALHKLARATHALAVHVHVEPGLTVEEPATVRALYRAAQEFVTNSARHAGAAAVHVGLVREGASVVLRAHDDGCGAGAFVPGHGLRGICERAEALGGSASFDTAPGRGFSMRVALPHAEVCP
jgi:signal transduction histidine kinase